MEIQYENLTINELAEAIKAVYKGYLQLTENLKNEERKAFDAELKKIINDNKIF